MAERFDLVIRHGTVVDGTRSPRYVADVAVSGDRITRIGALTGARGAVEIDATGKIVAPGFIDAHTHDDRLMLSAPEMAPKVSQGVTTSSPATAGFARPLPAGAAAGHAARPARRPGHVVPVRDFCRVCRRAA
jgi:N-acyl-D-amino-acid deacylase